jgi:sulfotransferase
LELLESITGKGAKVLVPVRDLRDVLASFEKLHRKNMGLRQSEAEKANYLGFQTVKQRCETWSRFDQPVGLAYNRIKDALQRGWKDKMFFVDYNKFTSTPLEMLKSVYAFLEEDWFEHDVHNVEQVTWEDDEVHGYASGVLHGIRKDIRPQPPQWPAVLGGDAAIYDNQTIW